MQHLTAPQRANLPRTLTTAAGRCLTGHAPTWSSPLAVASEEVFAVLDSYAGREDDPREMTREEAATFLLLVAQAENSKKPPEKSRRKFV